MQKKVYKKKWPRKILGELANFLEGFCPDGGSLQDLSEKISCSEAWISGVFCKDDMKLSKAEDIVRRLGYELNLFFPQAEFGPGQNPPKPRYVFANAGNLAGLIKYINDNEYKLSMVAWWTHVNEPVIRNAFAKGDILLSTLYAMVEAMGIDMIWDFQKIDDKTMIS